MARKRTATAIYVVFGLGVGAFVVASITQVAGVSFHPAAPGPLSPACASGIRTLVGVMDRASAAAEAAPDGNAARSAFTAALAPEWDRKDEVSQSCKAGEDVEAYAETRRLERILEEHAASRAREAGPLRKRLEARIGVEGRK